MLRLVNVPNIKILETNKQYEGCTRKLCRFTLNIAITETLGNKSTGNIWRNKKICVQEDESINIKNMKLKDAEFNENVHVILSTFEKKFCK